MMKHSDKIRPVLLVAALTGSLLATSCKKFLEAKSDQSITTPSTIDDLDGLLNAYTFINAKYPSATEISSDNFYLTDADWGSALQRQRDYYLWVKTADIGADYSSPYQSIAYANVVLETLPKISAEPARIDRVRGSALFVRGSYHFALAQLFAGVFDPATAASDRGIALRLTADISTKATRATLSETYAFIIGDLKEAAALLPDQPAAKYQPGKAAAYGMLSRVYLAMQDYAQAGNYADSCLQLYHTLIDHNTLSASAAIPFRQFNDEVIYDAVSQAPGALSQARAKVDTLLFRSYAADDLRKTIWFRANADGSQAYKGSLSGTTNGSLFTGIATDEMLLNKAECAVRAGDAAGALQALNTLLVTRWKKGTYIPVTITNGKELLRLILTERRKELIFRGLRWTDLKRLNRDPETAQVIFRNINKTLYRLEPGSPRYLLQIDQNAVNIGGLEQNP